ncbi:hypothetical protein H8F18_16470 [Vibrio fluvialis]|uniref:Uncharacterized protein n=1 Tax=Vibrio cholerae TaxID=666 RepID=A0A7Z7VM29_VIBCL|nr:MULTISPECIES: hypothetical protein [Vibrio]MBL4244022.1 hypothetical protein [Vibrio fluvialis]MBL4252938.1 hypothetical protein [Vibrio fluvialis]PNV69620.1 hypothetical protein C1Y48_17300 [Vibrio cholerae]TBM40594.1 hypothetical protein EYB64_14270 [Vibrio cholerae]BEI26105.1 hypothetical protein KKIDH5335_44370 [Vibrio fluvialis]
MSIHASSDDVLNKPLAVYVTDEEKEEVLPKGYYKATLWGCAGSPEITVYSNGEHYFSFDSANPAEPLEPSDFVISQIPLFPTPSEEALKYALNQALEFIVNTGNDYKRNHHLSIHHALEAGSLVTEIESLLFNKESDND